MLKKLLVCNVLPHAWDMPDYARALPHWTVDEFFEKLELFLAGEFDIDHRAKKITFAFSRDVLAGTPAVRLDSVVDEFSANVKADGSDCDYLETKNLAYKDTGHQLMKYFSCPWYIRQYDTISYDTMAEMMEACHSLIWPTGDGPINTPADACIVYVRDVDMHFISRTVDRTRTGSGYNYKVVFQPVNEFGPRIENPEDDDSVEIEFTPACVDYTDSKYGFCLFCNCGSYSEDTAGGNNGEGLLPTLMQMWLELGEKGERHEYYSHIAVGYYDGYYKVGAMPYPEVSPVMFDYDTYSFRRLPNFSLGLNNAARSPIYNVDRTRRVTFKFISHTIPSPRALYYIKGKRFICEKITATFTESGMSQLLKGEFFPLLD